LNTLHFHDEFDNLNFYNPVNNPNGVWRFNDFWQDPQQAGYIDFAGNRTFMVNQMTTGGGTTSYSNANAYDTIRPYFPASQPEPSMIRLLCQRAHLDTRPSLRGLVNDVAVNNQGIQPDQVTWLGAFMTTDKIHPFPSCNISRPAYIEARIRFNPVNTTGIFSAFWLYKTSEDTKNLEVDIFETNDLNPSFWKTNFQDAGGGFFSIAHNNAWCDNLFHTYGLLWQQSSFKTYKDGQLDGSWEDAPGPGFFDQPMRLMITHTCDPYWSTVNTSVQSNIENVYMDIDFIRVWTES